MPELISQNKYERHPGEQVGVIKADTDYLLCCKLLNTSGCFEWQQQVQVPDASAALLSGGPVGCNPPDAITIIMLASIST